MNRFFRAWYQDPSHYTMRQEEWLFVAYTLLACINGFGVGVVVGLLI